VAGVGREADGDLVAGGGLAFGEVAEVILHVAVAADDVGDKILGEFVEDEGQRLAEEIGEDIEAAAVGHTHDDFFHFARLAALQDGVENDEQRLGPLEQGRAAAREDEPAAVAAGEAEEERRRRRQVKVINC